jgi:hypothetical protein
MASGDSQRYQGPVPGRGLAIEGQGVKVGDGRTEAFPSALPG